MILRQFEGGRYIQAVRVLAFQLQQQAFADIAPPTPAGSSVWITFSSRSIEELRSILHV